MIPPLHFRWDGDALVPLRPILADRHYVVGETYSIVEHHDRSANSHRHYFAALGNAWSNLPDRMLEEFPTAEVLRKKLLIRAGYADERSIVCASKAEAQRVAAFVKPMDDYAIVTVREAVVRVYTAQSQSVKAMGAKAFQESKTKVLEALDDLLGVERGATARSEAA
ncbi:hypothetical protein FJ973_29815 [Mesorhizobium sp. B2-1-3]|uniref:hypothetical protein n=1 Tax=Mesorhizobium sp. B2-1-3 TaxID=2589972 RepID=UPI001125DC43|nr:hypothetical protein [Mesorhizobium sp. B2-1-3]TPN03842.1 hypothetical protein FJ973_29815 [Mesorhizobium sp. B2-1-3]